MNAHKASHMTRSGCGLARALPCASDRSCVAARPRQPDADGGGRTGPVARACRRRATAVVIEATEPVAYTVNRPDAADAGRRSARRSRGRRDDAGAAEGARLRRSGSSRRRRPTASASRGCGLRWPRRGISVKSSRNTIRVELASRRRLRRPPSRLRQLPAPLPRGQIAGAGRAGARAPSVEAASRRLRRLAASADGRGRARHGGDGDRAVRTARQGTSTVVTISGNGKLSPTGVTESRDLPRRLILDFPNVASRAAAQTHGRWRLVRRVRVGLNSHTPLVTRVVMEIADGATYVAAARHDRQRELAVVFEGPRRRRYRRSARRGAKMRSLAVLGAETITLAQAHGQRRAAGAAGIRAPTRHGARSTPATTATATSPRRACAPSPSPAPHPAGRQAAAAQNRPPRRRRPPRAAARRAAAGDVAGLQGPQSQQIAAAQEKKYIGHPISMDFQGVDLRSRAAHASPRSAA